MGPPVPSRTQRLTASALLAGVVAVCAQLAIPVPGLAAPITLQTAGVSLAGLILGARDGAISMLVYLGLGVCGLPVFAQFAAGPGVLVGPSGGFLLGFVGQAALTGWWERRFPRGPALVLGITLGVAVTMVSGTLGLRFHGFSTGKAVALVGIYLPGAVLKILGVAWIWGRLAPLLPPPFRR